MHRTQLFLPEEMHRLIKEEAKEQKKTLSEYVRDVLNDHLIKRHRNYTEKGIQSLMKMTEEK